MSMVSAKVELRTLGMGDLPGIERIERRSYPTPWSRSMFAGEIVKPSSICVGAFDAETGALAGYMIISRYVDAWHLMNIAVAPEHRRRGVARTLLDHMIRSTNIPGHRGYTLEVRVSNTDAIRLYESVGFTSRGIRRGYYTDNREDAMIMWKDPLPGPAPEDPGPAQE